MLLLGLALACSRTPAEPVPPPESVLLITVDTLRADHLGTYGYALARTPRIDALAADGVRLDDHATSAPITLPAHTSMCVSQGPDPESAPSGQALEVGVTWGARNTIAR